eukprot:PITA_04886
MDALENVAARFPPLRDGFSIELLYKPFVPDNITNLRIFNDDQQILHFMDNVDVFKDATIDEDEHDKTFKFLSDVKNTYKISLNPKKSIFIVSEGNLLGHIIAKSGIKVDPERVKAITQIPFPLNKKAMQFFLGKIMFLYKFISNYAQIVKPMQEMVKKDAIYKWDKREKDAFSHIRQTIVEALTLYNLNFNKDFLLYTFTSDTSLEVVLMHKDD